MIDSEDDTSIVEASGSGLFSQKLSLNEGANKFIITSYSEKGDSTSKVLTVFYVPEKS
jgi:phenylacetate-coenzyme A ligase PaaK-like adenylate-forming protein